MKYVSTNSGILAPSMVKDGDRIIIIEDAYSTFSAAKQTTYWNAKVQLPDGSHKLAGLMESVCDAFAAKWGDETSAWTGHTAIVQIKTSKAGNPYIMLAPTDDAVVNVQKIEAAPAPVAEVDTIEYPEETINPDDIPF